MAPRNASPSLLDELSRSLASLPGEHTYSLQVVRSQPRRSYALFPYASNRKTAKVWQEECLVVLSEERDVPVVDAVQDKSVAAGDAPAQPLTTTAAASSSSSRTRRALVPIVGLEASIYTIPCTSSSLLYISKVDTTGLQPSSTAPNPTRSLVAAFLSYHLAHPPHDTARLRIHIFAKSQPQYLFPGSVENDSKKVLDDKGLIRWWKSCLERGAIEYSTTHAIPAPQPQMFYLIPGLSYLESLPYVPVSSLASAPKWTYSHPNATLTSLLHPRSTSPSDVPLTDHIPAFPDDPKSRFITSLTSSAVASSGNEHDYDDLMLSMKSAAFTTGTGSTGRREEVELQREKEARRMRDVEGGTEGWWEQMAWRQECCSGVLVGFFVVGLEPVIPAVGSEVDGAKEGVPTNAEPVLVKTPRKQPLAIPHALFTRLWSQFHNVDYALPAVAKCAAAAQKWQEDAERATRAEVEHAVGVAAAESEARSLAEYEREVKRRVVVSNPLPEKEGAAMKRPAEVKPVVNMMVPRKKKPKTA